MNPSLAAITFDCTDAARLAEFWSALLGRAVDPDASADFASIGWATSRPAWMFIKVPESKVVKNRVHVDLVSQDRPADVERALALGATVLGGFDEGGNQWTTLADPEGNEFDIVSGGH